jgi:DNA-binding CsgD family transcriptional regulator/tetratricopeptide (TPR) repeat protein
MQLLEREAQLQSLDDALREVHSGAGRITLVYGEAGIGKTSLVEHFLIDKTDTWRILRGACEALFSPRPLGPVYDVALQTRGELLKELQSGKDRNALFGTWLAELSCQPTILVVEDIHWADEATLDLLKYLGRRVRQTRSLIILTHRDNELGADHPVRQLLGELGNSDTCHRVPVTPLSSDAVRQLAGDLPINPGELHTLTNGNPFYVTEVLAAGGSIPATVRDAVLARTARLSERAREVLEAAAVIGLRTERWLLSIIVRSASSSIEECLAAGMLQSQGDDYLFRHELARQTILESLTPHRKVALHRRVLAALQATAETRTDLARLANHAEGTRDAPLVLEYAPAAARQAAAAGAHRQAAILYELALRFADSLPTARHAQLLEAYADEQWFQGLRQVVPVRLKVIKKHRELGDRLREGANLALLASELRAAGQYAESEKSIGAAIAMLESLPPSVELALAYRAQGYLRLASGDLLQSVAAGEKSIALSERFGAVDILARACRFVGFALLLMEDDRGRAFMQRSLDVGRAHGLHWAVGLTLAGWTHVLAHTFHFEEAAPLLQEGIAYTTEHDDDGHLGHLLCTHAWMQLYQGHWTAASSLLDQILEQPDLRPLWYFEARLTLGRLGARRGDAGVPAILGEALEECSRADFFGYELTLRATRAEAAWLQVGGGQDLEETRSAYDRSAGQHLPWSTGELAFWCWRAGDVFAPPEWIARPYALQIAGDWRAAAEAWEQRGCPYERGMALMDGDEPAQLEALRIFERLGARPIIAKLKRKMRIQGMHGIPRGPRASTRESAFGLTSRELEVLACVTQGSSSIAIAQRLSLSSRTVDHHIASILRKTGTQSRGEAAALALREKLVVS